MSITTNDVIRDLRQNSSNVREFFEGLLRHTVVQTNAVSGIVWDCQAVPLHAVAQIQTQTSDVFKIGISETEHMTLISRAGESSESLLIRPKPDALGKVEPSHPVILVGVINRSRGKELIELFLRQGLTQQKYQQHLRGLESVCKTVASSGVELEAMSGQKPASSPFQPNLSGDLAVANVNQSSNHDGNGSFSRSTVTQQRDQYIHRIHRSLDLGDTSTEIANELRRVLDCDRVTVVQQKSRHCKILAISGQPSVNRRSNTVQLLSRLADKVLPLRTQFWYPDQNMAGEETTQDTDQSISQPPGELPQQIESPLNDYLAVSATRSLVIVPIFDRSLDEEQSPNMPQTDPTVIGGLVIEQCRQQWSRDAVSDAIESTTRHASDAFRNSHSHRQLLFYPVWKWLGKSKVVMAARNMKASTSVVAAIALVGLFLALWPAQFRLNCDGQLIPENRSNVFAEVDGIVSEVLVRHGDMVKPGHPLIHIDNLDFKYQHQELVGQIKELEQTIVALESQRLTNRSSEEKQNRHQNIQSQKAQLTSLKLQLELVSKKLEKLTVVSPRQGQIVSWNLKETLSDRPVSRGEILMEVADVDGDWQLELNLSDRKIGHLLTSFREQSKQSGDDDVSEANTEPSKGMGIRSKGSRADEGNDRGSGAETKHGSLSGLKVDFILAADPSQRFSGTIREIGTATEIDPDRGQTVRIKVDIDASEFDIRQVKSGVTAYIHCGRRSIGYVWFHPVLEFLQRKVFFPLF